MREFQIALAKGDVPRALAYMADDIVCDVIGHKRTKGKDAYFAAFADALKTNKAKELVIENIITHGSTGAVNGCLTTANGTVHAFYDIYIFSGASAKAKIKEVKEYDIEIEHL